MALVFPSSEGSGKRKLTQLSDENKPRDGIGNDTPHNATKSLNEESNATKSLNEDPDAFFACPFFQRDPHSLWQGRWKICAIASWNHFHRVRCFEDLKDAQSLLLHRNQVHCEQKADLYRIADQIFQLKIPLKRGSSEGEKWNNMYRILFPEDTHIPSPYKHEPSYGTEEFAAWAAEIERIRNSTSLDVRTQIDQIMSAANSAIRSLKATTHDDEETTQKFVKSLMSFERDAEESAQNKVQDARAGIKVDAAVKVGSWGDVLSSGSGFDLEFEIEKWKATECDEISEPAFNFEPPPLSPSPSLSPIIRCEENMFDKPARLTTGFTNSRKTDIKNETKATSRPIWPQNGESTSELQAKAAIRAVGDAVQEAEEEATGKKQKHAVQETKQTANIVEGGKAFALPFNKNAGATLSVSEEETLTKLQARAIQRAENTCTEDEDELAFLLNQKTELPRSLSVERIEQLEEAEKSIPIIMDKGDQAIEFNTGLDRGANHNAATDDITMPNDDLAKSAVSDEITTINMASNYLTDAEQVATLIPATDSGYASLLTHNYKGPVPSTKMNDNKDFHSNGSDINSTNFLDNEDQPRDDTGSVYTAGPDISPAKKEAYISSLADDLLNKVSKEKLDEENLNKICKALPRHLNMFAIKVGASDSALICREIMVFVRRYRNEIANSLRKIYVIENSVRSDVLGDNTAGMHFSDVINKWNLNPDQFQDPNNALNDKPNDVMDDSHYDNLDAMDRATDSLPELSAYRDFISMHPAYEWLLQSIQKELHMDMPGNIQAKIRDTILGHLPRAQIISTREAPKIYILTFTADWDPVLFLKEQEYRESLEKAVEHAITITGSKIDAQAVTTTQYLQQIWPSSGIHLLHVVKHVVRGDSNMPFSYNLPDRTQLIAWSQGLEFKLEVTGTAESIADIGEQLAWIGSALRSSHHESGLTTVSAFVSNIGTNSTSKMTEGHASSFFCNIGFNVDLTDDAGEIPNGQCWHQLFHNAVIVDGFPIPRRPKSSAGLEISLDTLASLTGTRYINTFNNKLFIKGFSTMLVPTRYSDNVLLWHLLCNKNGDRVSYLDGTDIHADNVSLPDLEKSRHILGWSSSIKYLVGSADANYNISSSWLTLLRESCKLESTSISKAQLIKSNHEAAIGKREKPPWIIRDPHRKRLDFLSQKYMVLWDVGCKRGWLVNGVNALLHLLRASIALNKVDRPPPEFKLKEAKIPYTASAAREVLFNFENLDMELYDEYEQHESGAKIKFRVCDRINDLFETLEKVIDYQKMIADVREKSPKSAPRKDLEGWDFKDIATSKSSTYYLRLAKLTTIGKVWVDFTRAIGAVFLFGRDFGNLMDPVPETSTCSHWEVLPTGKFYLAASVEDLNAITERMGGNPTKTPPRLTDSLVWHPLNMALNLRCDCSTHTETYCERARAIWPKGTCPKDMSRHFPICSPLSLNDSGAVVFGYSANLGWIWNDFGDPEMGELPLMDAESDDDNSPDSGIDLSLRSSTIPESQHTGQNNHSCKNEHYKIAIICALPEELMAVRVLFDETHRNLPQHGSDANTYALGRLGTHYVVAACLPREEYGTNAASRVASDIEKSFPAVKWYFVVGIGGGIPSYQHDIRLGDVVVSTGVIQHDMGKVTQKGSRIKSTGFPQRPTRSLLTAISSMRSDPSLTHDALEAHIQHIVRVRPEYHNPGEDRDKLFPANSKHICKQKTCENCKGPPVPKKPRLPGPHIHYGLIASGNQVIKDAITRDRIGAEMNVLCFEMEGVGVMTTGNCLVVRGICDYADSHKNDEWHNYAAATAAAYTKLFLLRVPNLDMQNREVVQTRKRSASSMEDDGIHLSKRALDH